MTIELTPGASAQALEALAEDMGDVAVTKAREHEPRVSLDEAEAELRVFGKLK